MLTKYDEAVIAYAHQHGINSEYVYRQCEKDKRYKGYRDRHTDDELIQMFESTKQKLEDVLHKEK